MKAYHAWGLAVCLLMASGDLRGEAFTWQPAMPLGRSSAVTLTPGQAAETATDNSNTWIAVFSAAESDYGAGFTADADIFFVRSTDDCATWSVPVPLNIDFASDGTVDIEPAIAAGSGGHWICVWERQSSTPSARGIYFSRSINNGATWSVPTFVDDVGNKPAIAYSPVLGWVLGYSVNNINVYKRTMGPSEFGWSNRTLVKMAMLRGCPLEGPCTLDFYHDIDVVLGNLGREIFTEIRDIRHRDAFGNPVSEVVENKEVATSLRDEWYFLEWKYSSGDFPSSTSRLYRTDYGTNTNKLLSLPEPFIWGCGGNVCVAEDILTLAWFSQPAGSPGVLKSAVSRNKGESWESISTVDGPRDFEAALRPVIVSDTGGRFLMVWHERMGSGTQLRFSTLQVPRAAAQGGWEMYE